MFCLISKYGCYTENFCLSCLTMARVLAHHDLAKDYTESFSIISSSAAACGLAAIWSRCIVVVPAFLESARTVEGERRTGRETALLKYPLE